VYCRFSSNHALIFTPTGYCAIQRPFFQYSNKSVQITLPGRVRRNLEGKESRRAFNDAVAESLLDIEPKRFLRRFDLARPSSSSAELGHLKVSEWHVDVQPRRLQSATFRDEGASPYCRYASRLLRTATTNHESEKSWGEIGYCRLFKRMYVKHCKSQNRRMRRCKWPREAQPHRKGTSERR
jgi:hypothetical protein